MDRYRLRRGLLFAGLWAVFGWPLTVLTDWPLVVPVLIGLACAAVLAFLDIIFIWVARRTIGLER